MHIKQENSNFSALKLKSEVCTHRNCTHDDDDDENTSHACVLFHDMMNSKNKQTYATAGHPSGFIFIINRKQYSALPVNFTSFFNSHASMNFYFGDNFLPKG